VAHSKLYALTTLSGRLGRSLGWQLSGRPIEARNGWFWPNPAIGERRTLHTDHDLPELVINVTGIRNKAYESIKPMSHQLPGLCNNAPIKTIKLVSNSTAK
jgi:hypothetical protein